MAKRERILLLEINGKKRKNFVVSKNWQRIKQAEIYANQKN
jgi:hypothetical protein